nr:ABC transporter B family member 25-like [Ipomoea batatas]
MDRFSGTHGHGLGSEKAPLLNRLAGRKVYDSVENGQLTGLEHGDEVQGYPKQIDYECLRRLVRRAVEKRRPMILEISLFSCHDRRWVQCKLPNHPQIKVNQLLLDDLSDFDLSVWGDDLL